MAVEAAALAGAAAAAGSGRGFLSLSLCFGLFRNGFSGVTSAILKERGSGGEEISTPTRPAA